MLKEWVRSKRLAVERRVAYMHKLRLRALGVLVGLGLAVVGIVSMTAAPAWPVVFGAFAVAALVVNKVAAQLSKTVCIGCGQRIDSEPVGQYGVVCPTCGTVSASSKAEQAETLDAWPGPVTGDDADEAE